MQEVVTEKSRQAKTFFENYGKVLTVILCIVISALAIHAIYRGAEPLKLTVSFLDVGQGDAILIETPAGHDMLIDGGPGNAVMQKLSRELSFFDRDIDVMIATHGDADHITGLIPFLKKYEVKTVVRSPVDATTDTFKDLDAHIQKETGSIHIARRGDTIDFGDGVMVHVLYPSKNISPKLETNDASVSVVLTYGEHSFLLTGDLGGRYESQLLQPSLPKNVTVYKAGHHGSKTSSTESLLSYAKPEYAVVSAGKDNRYGHPNTETLARLEKYSEEVLSTIDRGTISFISDGRLLQVITEK